jgi:two-component system response regulator GlrR
MSNIRGMRVLLVEDQLDNQKLFMAFLEYYGVSAYAVRNGEDALHALRESRFHAVLTDIGLPGMDGLTLAQRIIAEHGKQFPVIILSAFGDVSRRLKAHDLGVSSYLLKPIDHQQLKTALEKIAADVSARA